MNKIILVIIGVVVIALVIFGIRFFSGEDSWICQNGEWVKHGNPSAPKPTESCGESQNPPEETLIIVNTPKPNDMISSPLEVTGKARGGWYFEASFPLRLLDENGKIIAFTNAQAQSDWMTNDFVPFKAMLEFAPPVSATGTLVLEKDNPSGLPQNAAQITIPIRFKQTQTSTVKVFFNNDKMDPEYSCNKVFPVEREIPKTQTVARAALEELLKGPSAADKAAGYFTSINSGVKIQKLTIENGVAKVDFDEQLEFQVGGSCRVAAISAQITQTLKQFPTVKSVIISINGRTEDILQP